MASNGHAAGLGVDLFGLVGGEHTVKSDLTLDAVDEPCACFPNCPLCKNPKAVGKAGLLWIGEKFYKTPNEFMREGREMGFSRRVHAVPRNFKVGETWVMLAHPKGIGCADCEGTGASANPADIEDPSCLMCHGTGKLPAIFTLWRPTRIEKLYVESQRDSEETKKAIEQGITPVFVPDDDPDHQGSVHDKQTEDDAEDVVA